MRPEDSQNDDQGGENASVTRPDAEKKTSKDTEEGKEHSNSEFDYAKGIAKNVGGRDRCYCWRDVR